MCAQMLNELGLTADQFIDVCILCGCDYTSSIRGEHLRSQRLASVAFSCHEQGNRPDPVAFTIGCLGMTRLGCFILMKIVFAASSTRPACALFECDATNAPAGIGPVKALSSIKKEGSIEAMLTKLDTNKYPVPDPFPYEEARRLFQGNAVGSSLSLLPGDRLCSCAVL